MTLLPCAECSFRGTKPALKLHRKTVHHVTHQCELCEFQTDKITVFKRHKRTEHKPQLPCDKCEFKGTRKELKLHKKAEHKEWNIKKLKIVLCWINQNGNRFKPAQVNLVLGLTLPVRNADPGPNIENWKKLYLGRTSKKQCCSWTLKIHYNLFCNIFFSSTKPIVLKIVKEIEPSYAMFSCWRIHIFLEIRIQTIRKWGSNFDPALIWLFI